MRTSKLLLKIFIILVLIMPVFLVSVPASYAQTGLEWSEPVNLSLSGSSTNPSIVVDARGTIHVIWFDKLDGYKYAESADGISWSPPKIVKFPFSREEDTAPTFLVDDNEIHIFWRDSQSQTLYYSRALFANFDAPSSWTNSTELADSVVTYDAKISLKGNLYVSYIVDRGTTNTAPGVNLRRLDGAGWSQPKSIYSSQYFRSIKPEDSNIHIGVLDRDSTNSIIVVWDDRSQKKIFLSESSNNGNDWDPPLQISGPEDYIGLTFPFNINIGFQENNPLLVWWAGIPGEYCSLYSQRYDMDKNQLDVSSRLRKEISPCPQSSDFIVQENELSILLLNSQDELSFTAWDGSTWSTIQNQNDLSVFENPVTLDGVLFGCKKTAFYIEKIYVVGCDKGVGGDIWFRSRELGPRDAWFPPPSAWKIPVQITSINQRISQLISVSDEKNNIHTFWLQSSSVGGSEAKTLYYSKWSNGEWSKPISVLSESNEQPIQFYVSADIPNRLLLTWVDGQTGGIMFSWVNSDRVANRSEWDTPVYVPTISPITSSPKILADVSGRIIITYAVPLNERRGVYYVLSDDAGRTWSGPFLIFDAFVAGWDGVDKPEIGLSGDGRLHIVFERFTLQGDQRRSMGIYYSQSVDGGRTWSDAEMVSEQPISWSRIVGFAENTVHRLWQERNGTNLVDFHQFSQDGGESWSKPVSVGAGTDEICSPSIDVDKSGNIHILQLVENDGISIIHHEWNGLQWSMQESHEIKKYDVPNTACELVSDLSPGGNFIAIVLIRHRDLAGSDLSEILSVERSLDMQTSSIAVQPVLIPTSDSSNTAVETQEVITTPTQTSPMADLNEPSVSIAQTRNLVGLLFLIAALFLTVVILRPRFGGRRQ